MVEVICTTSGRSAAGRFAARPLQRRVSRFTLETKPFVERELEATHNSDCLEIRMSRIDQIIAFGWNDCGWYAKYGCCCFVEPSVT
jgi:hypothetical protein